MGHRKPGKSWILSFHFQGLERHGIEVWVMESHGKAIYFQRKKISKRSKVKALVKRCIIVDDS